MKMKRLKFTEARSIFNSILGEFLTVDFDGSPGQYVPGAVAFHITAKGDPPPPRIDDLLIVDPENYPTKTEWTSACRRAMRLIRMGRSWTSAFLEGRSR